MSIATDVSRIKGNITAALAAIADKGVTVPDGSTSDALASLIASIEAGGGGVTGITYGIYIPAVTGYDHTIEHGLGVVPKIFAICAASYVDAGSYVLDSAHGFSDRNLLFRMSRATAGNSPSGYIKKSDNITQSSFAKNTAIAKATAENISVGGNYTLTAGAEYFWFATV